MKKNNFLIYSILIATTRFFDGYTTYLATSDLSDEANPFIKLFAGHWLLLILFGTIFTIAVLIGFYYSYKNQYLLTKKAIDIQEYIGIIFYDRKVSFIELFYKVPMTKAFFVFLGLSFSISLLYFSFFLIVNNLFVLCTYYNSFCYSVYFSIVRYFTLIFMLVPIAIYLSVSYLIIKQNFDKTNKSQ